VPDFGRARHVDCEPPPAAIDDTLAALISPETALFPVEQPVRDHGYPEGDLSDIDADWW
jgi:hypothetical protein